MLFRAQRLTFDVIIHENSDQSSNQSPRSISIVIIDEGLQKQFPLSESGVGISEALFLLAIVIGLTESVILLDEPSSNFHPTLLKSIAGQIMTIETGTENNNQFVTITQSPELVDYMLFELNADAGSLTVYSPKGI